jgi:alpha-mannosidase
MPSNYVKLTFVAAALLAIPAAMTASIAGQEPAKVVPAPQPPTSTQPAVDRELYVVATSHLDTQWLWTIQTTINEYIPLTLRQNFALFEKYPDYIFSFEGAYRYMLAREYYPEEYAKLKKYIADGRWQLCGSSVDACDVNIPSPQSLIRQTLYGNGFFKKEFGKTSCDIFLPDCFGFGYALPSVASHCGLKGFSTQKLTWGSSIGIPFDIGMWEGVDGSALIAAINPGAYVSEIREDLSADPKWLAAIDKLGEQSGLYLGYKYFGVGDTGGAPDDESVSWLEKSIAAKGPIRVVSAPADKLYRDLTAEQTANLPRYKGELLMSRHGTGCYTSQAAMKRWNRKNEQLADAAERASVVADWLGGAAYPARKLTDSWIRFLWHQFHDDLTGTSTPLAYPFSWNDEIISLSQFAAVLTDAAGAVSRAMDTRAKGVPLVVFNPLSIDREDVVEATVKFDKEAPRAVRVYAADGKEVPSQFLAVEGGEARLAFLANVPSIGFAVYDVRPAETPCDMATDLKVTAAGMENGRYRVRLDENGDVAGIFDKAANKELLAAPARLQLLEDTPDKWSEWEIWYDDLSAEPKGCVGKPAAVQIVERGPARVTLEVARSAEGSTFVQRIRLAAGGAAERLEFDTRLDWRTPRRALKAAFPLAVANPRATYDLGLGTIQRGNNNEKLNEGPAQQWADITAPDGEYGVAILNDCKYGWDKPADNTLRLTLVHSPHNIQKDMGWHRFAYAVCGHKGDWREGAQWQAARLNQPLVAFQVPQHGGPLEQRFSLLNISTPQVAALAVKKAEESDEIVVRLQELHGKPAERAHVAMAVPIVAAREVTGAEEPLDTKVTVEEGQLVFDMKPYQPRTFAVKPGAATVKLAPPTSKRVPLPFDTDVIGLDGEKTGGEAPPGAFDAEGRAIAGELLPTTIVSEGIPFEMGPSVAGQKNAVTCRGQVIDLPSGNFNRVYLLAAAAGDDTSGTFTIGDTPVERGIASYTGYVGQSQSLVVKGEIVDATQMAEPFIKRDNIAWVGGHRHAADGKNEAYVFTYLFKYAFDLPKDAAQLKLPDNDKIRVLAITMADNHNDAVAAAGPLYDRIIAPKIAPAGGLTIEPVSVTLSTDAKGGKIRYTLDGSEPSPSSKLYEGPITIKETATVSARVFVGAEAADYVGRKTYTFVQPRKAEKPANVVPGLSYKYFEGEWKKQLVTELADLEPVKTGTVDSFDLAPRGRDEKIGFEFTGFVEVPRDGVYTFFTKSDDASKLFIGDVEVVDNDGPHGATEIAGKIALAAGKHAIRVVYLQGGGDFELKILYEGPEVPKQPIPATALCHEKGK